MSAVQIFITSFTAKYVYFAFVQNRFWHDHVAWDGLFIMVA